MHAVTIKKAIGLYSQPGKACTRLSDIIGGIVATQKNNRILRVSRQNFVHWKAWIPFHHVFPNY